MASTSERLQTRNREIGAILAEARQRQHRTVTECAGLLGTSRRRYGAVERGEVGVSAAELELLLEYLEVPPQAVWQELRPQVERGRVILRVPAGETVRLIVEARGQLPVLI